MKMYSIAAFVLLLITLPTNILGQPTVGLTQTDYPTSSDGLTINIEVSRLGSHADEIVLRVRPLTPAAYEAEFGDTLPCGPVSGFLNGDDPAEDGDFNSTVIEKVIPANPTGASATFPFEVAIFPDDIIEDNEIFVILLDFEDELSITIGRRCAVGRIRGEGIITRDILQFSTTLSADVNFIRFREDIGSVVLLTIEKVVESELPISVTVQPMNVNSFFGNDFTITRGPIIIAPDECCAEIEITVDDDVLLEDTVMYIINVMADVADVGINIDQRFTTTIEIVDNDVGVLGFQTTSEEIDLIEGETYSLCASLLNVSRTIFFRQAVVYEFSSEDGTAKAGEDYAPVQDQYRPLVDNPVCVDLTATDNEVVNGPRFYTVSFLEGQDELDPLTIIRPSFLRVNIIDNDGVPLAPVIQEIKPSEDAKELVVVWTSDTSPDRPITGFSGNITVRGGSELDEEEEDSKRKKRALDDNGFVNFITNSTTMTYSASGFDEDKDYDVFVCAENINGRNCSSGSLLKTTPPSQEVRLAPGLIVVIVIVVVVVLMFCCLFFLLLLLCFCCWRVEREKTYFPAKAEKKQLGGIKRSPDSSYSLDDDEDFEFTSTPV